MKLNIAANSIELQGIVIDNFLFGISTVGKNGFESKVVFHQTVFAFIL